MRSPRAVFGEHVIASLRRIDGGPGTDQWSLSITAFVRPPGMMRGREDSKDAVKAAIGRTVRRWLDAIGETDLTERVIARHRVGGGYNRSLR
jgi:hypothetical protein